MGDNEKLKAVQANRVVVVVLVCVFFNFVLIIIFMKTLV